jgi:hypothetical protein
MCVHVSNEVHVLSKTSTAALYRKIVDRHQVIPRETSEGAKPCNTDNFMANPIPGIFLTAVLIYAHLLHVTARLAALGQLCTTSLAPVSTLAQCELALIDRELDLLQNRLLVHHSLLLLLSPVLLILLCLVLLVLLALLTALLPLFTLLRAR